MMTLLQELNRRNVLRVAVAYIVSSWLLIQVAETIFPLFGLGDGPARLVVIILAIGFVPMLIVSWVFELTPDGLKLDREVDKAQSIAPQTGKKLDRIIMVVLALALAYFAFDKFVLDPARDTQIAESATRAGAEQAMEAARLDMFNEKSVAVLPFINRSEAADDAFFTDGMHDELLTRLSKISSLKVISRTSVMRYRDTQLSIPQIARELSVAAILEGGVQRAGNQIRINVQLINASTDEHLWAEIYDRDLSVENVFAIQSEISSNIAQALNATLSPEEHKRVYKLPTDSLEANNHYMRGRQLQVSRKAAELDEALTEFESAVALDPEFALAWVGIADTIRMRRDTGQMGLDMEEDRRKSLAAIEKALNMDPELGEAYISLATHYHDNNHWGEYDERNLEKAEAAFQKGIKLAPNYAQAYHWYALAVPGIEDSEKHLGLFYKAAQLDPMSSIIQFNIAASLNSVGRFEEALDQYERLLTLDPDFAVAYNGTGNLRVQNGQIAEGLTAFRKSLELDPANHTTSYLLGRAYLSLADFPSVMATLQSISETAGPDSSTAVELGFFLLLTTNNLPGIFELDKKLDPAYNQRPPVLAFKIMAYVQAGMLFEARETAEKIFPYLTEPGQWHKLHALGVLVDACTLAGILVNSGDETLGRQLLQETIHYQETVVPAYIQDSHRDASLAVCYLVAGEYDKAFAFYEARAEHGHFADWNIHRHWWWLAPVRETPRFVALNSMIEAKLAEQRALLAQMDARVGVQSGSE